MKSLRETIIDLKKQKKALGHFNVSNIEMLWAAVSAARHLDMPIVIGVSEGERDAFGVKQIVSLIKSIREETGRPLFLNADHTYSVERVKEAIDAGFDSVIFDGAQLSFEENVRLTKECIEYARSVRDKAGKEVLVEGELGYIGVGSQIIDALPAGVAVTLPHMTTPEDAKRFVEQTGVDLFAPAVGNLHGTLRDHSDPRLSISRIKEIAEALSMPLVLHGGSGLPDEDFTAGIDAGIAMIHISTELRSVYRKELEEALRNGPHELAPYKYTVSAKKNVESVIEKYVRLFCGRY